MMEPDQKPDWSSWNQRWTALQQDIAQTREKTQQIPADLLPRQASIDCMLQYLENFGGKQFQAFYDGFSQGRYEKDPENPPEYVFWIILDQIATDLAVLQQAAWQRVNSTALVQEKLKAADYLTQEALKPAARFFDGNVPVVLTYFQKHLSIRMTPYAPVAWIGVPYTCTGAVQDFLAIPHEVGHYIYWHGCPPGQKSFRELIEMDAPKKLPAFAYCWKEEIFADAYGCQVAGEKIAQSAQDLARVNTLTGFYQDDVEHPTPFLRPLIYTKILAMKDSQKASKLESGWLTYCQQRLADHQNRKNPAFEETDPKCFKPSDGFKQDITNVLGNEQSSAFTHHPGEKPVEWVINESLKLMGQVTSDWESQYGMLENQSISRGVSSSRWPDIGDLNPDNKAASLWQKKYPVLEPGQTLSREEWLPLMDFYGWATKGPTGNPRPK